MKRDQFVKGDSVEEKFESINKTLFWFSQQLHQYVIGVIPPSTVFNYVELPETPDGVVLRQMFPGSGTIDKGCLFVEKLERSELYTIEVEVAGAFGSTKTITETRQKLVMVEPKLEVLAGSRLIVRVRPQGLVHGVWTAFWFAPKIDEIAKPEFLSSELLKLMEKADEGV